MVRETLVEGLGHFSPRIGPTFNSGHFPYALTPVNGMLKIPRSFFYEPHVELVVGSQKEAEGHVAPPVQQLDLARFFPVNLTKSELKRLTCSAKWRMIQSDLEFVGRCMTQLRRSHIDVWV